MQRDEKTGEQEWETYATASELADAERQVEAALKRPLDKSRECVLAMFVGWRARRASPAPPITAHPVALGCSAALSCSACAMESLPPVQPSRALP